MKGSLRILLRSRHQRGAALLVTMILLGLIGITALLAFARGTESEADKERRTSQALAIAKEALIGFAGGVSLTGTERPGDLPCPDLDNDGSAELSCNNQAERLGRLPWKTLGLPDLRDGDGERLWYAVSDNFKNNNRTPCADHAAPGCLNSGTLGTISVRDSSGAIVHNATPPPPTNPDPITHSGIVALVIAPGAILQRQGAGVSQDRSCYVGGVWRCDPSGACLPSPSASDVPQCNAANYLDVLSGTEDNIDFGDGTTNGFIAGPALVNNSVVVNDRIMTIGRQDILPVLERRVAQEVALCLRDYAAANGQKYPWAADMLESGLSDWYFDEKPPTSFAPRGYGRIPDPPFNRTMADPGMGSAWVGGCKLLVGSSWDVSAGRWTANWWTNWKSQVLYAIAPAFQPGGAAACGSCLTVNRPSGGPVTSVRMVVIAAGRTLGGQNRNAPIGTVNTNPANYVELENSTSLIAPDPTFEIRFPSGTFNDRLAYFPMP